MRAPDATATPLLPGAPAGLGDVLLDRLLEGHMCAGGLAYRALEVLCRRLDRWLDGLVRAHLMRESASLVRLEVGAPVERRLPNGQWGMAGEVTKKHSDGTLDVRYDEADAPPGRGLSPRELRVRVVGVPRCAVCLVEPALAVFDGCRCNRTCLVCALRIASMRGSRETAACPSCRTPARVVRCFPSTAAAAQRAWEEDRAGRAPASGDADNGTVAAGTLAFRTVGPV